MEDTNTPGLRVVELPCDPAGSGPPDEYSPAAVLMRQPKPIDHVKASLGRYINDPAQLNNVIYVLRGQHTENRAHGIDPGSARSPILAPFSLPMGQPIDHSPSMPQDDHAVGGICAKP